MRKFPMILTVLAVAAVVMATAAFTHPLAVRNGVVTDYSAGATMTIRGEHNEETYALRGMGNSTSASGTTGTNPIAGLGVGAHVTVFAECFGGGNGSSGNGPSASVSSKGNANGVKNNGGNRAVANTNACVALFVVVRSAAPNSSSATGTTPSSTATSSSTTTPGTTGTTMPGTGTGTAMPGATPAVTPTATP